jgi:hypothetical protein
VHRRHTYGVISEYDVATVDVWSMEGVLKNVDGHCMSYNVNDDGYKRFKQ